MSFQQKNQNLTPDQSKIILRVTMIAMMITVGVLFFVTWTSVTKGDLTIEKDAPTLIFTFMAAMAAAASFVIPKLIYREKKNRVSINLSPEEKLQKIHTKALVSMALSESVAIFGFLVGRSTISFENFLPFGCCAIILLFIHGQSASRRINALNLHVNHLA